MTHRIFRTGLAAVLAALVVVALIIVVRDVRDGSRLHVVGYFDNSNGLFVGDDVRILGVNVGKISKIEAQPSRVKVDFWVSGDYSVPADADAVILSPGVVSARVIQLTPAYTGGPKMTTGTVIAQERTAVPVEWDDMRKQLQVLSNTLRPTEPGGTSTLGALITTAANNLRGEGSNMRDALIKASDAFSTLGDHSTDIAATVKNLSALVSALSGSTDLMGQLNVNLAAVSALLTDDPHEVSSAITDFYAATTAVKDFAEQNRDAFGTATERASSISQALADSIPDLKQTLHIAPNTAQNFSNGYEPSQAALSVMPAINNFANPLQFICGAIQAASRLGAEQSAKLCVQYLAPILKNREYNFLPIGANLLPGPIPFPFVGAAARPNEVDYSEDWMRPDFNPAAATTDDSAPPPAQAPGPAAAGPPDETGSTLPAEAQPTTTDPSHGLAGIMVPTGQP